jgi:hypothetical protein
MTTANDPISPLPDVLPDVDLPCTCGCSPGSLCLNVGAVGNFRKAKRSSTDGYVTAHPGGYGSIRRVPWNLVRAALAAEQRPEFKVGDWVSGKTSTGALVLGELSLLPEHLPDAANIRGTLGGTCGNYGIRRESLKHEPQPAPSRPACDACSVCGAKATGQCTFTAGVLAAAFPGERLYWCKDHALPAVPFRDGVLGRRKQLASPAEPERSLACNRTRTLVDGVCPCGACVSMRAKPTEPGRPSRDPYAGCSDFLREGIVGAAMREHDAARLSAMTPKQRQAAEMLLRPATPKKYREAPSTWPDDAWMDAGSCDP